MFFILKGRIVSLESSDELIQCFQREHMLQFTFYEFFKPVYLNSRMNGLRFEPDFDRDVADAVATAARCR
jgi:hypothetical protein